MLPVWWATGTLVCLVPLLGPVPAEFNHTVITAVITKCSPSFLGGGEEEEPVPVSFWPIWRASQPVSGKLWPVWRTPTSPFGPSGGHPAPWSPNFTIWPVRRAPGTLVSPLHHLARPAVTRHPGQPTSPFGPSGGHPAPWSPNFTIWPVRRAPGTLVSPLHPFGPSGGGTRHPCLLHLAASGVVPEGLPLP